MGEAAPLFGVAGAEPPPGARAEWFAGVGAVRLRAALIPAGGLARGSVVVSPGRTEPIEKYFEMAARLASRGFVVLIHDWRGQGLSARALTDRSLGHADGYGQFLEDYADLLAAFEARLPRPWLAVGHSMGGCLTLLALAHGEDRFSGALLSAPMLGLLTGQAPRPIARGLAGLFKALGRSGQAVFGPPAAVAPFEGNVLTHDPVRYARNLALVEAAPDLALGNPTWGWLDFAFSATRELQTGPGVPRVAIPVTVLAAGEDALVDNAALRRVTARLPHGRFELVPGARHELFQETDEIQAAVWKAFDELAGVKEGVGV
ncbi:MAG TPA: alpha/beta hydrolase [Caulobacteraceae bacterium]|nr:alpha/beta hydrolase [Caulobacteraceae bacterium]